MADVHTKEKRSFNMSRIRGSDTKPEVRLRRIIWSKGYRYTKTNKDIAGKPDIAFRGKRVAVFIDGCFWHKCPKHFKQPSNNAEFWRKKIHSNTIRDKKVSRILRAQGWKVLRIWEHDLQKNSDKVVRRICTALKKSSR